MARPREASAAEIVRLESVFEALAAEVGAAAAVRDVPRGAGRAHDGRGRASRAWSPTGSGSTSRPNRPPPPRRWRRRARCSRRPGRRARGSPTRPCCASCSGAASTAGCPLQLHSGYGDPDLELHRCDPLLLTRFLRLVEPRGVDVLLLHCYPYHRQAGYLAQVFPHVYFDVGLAVTHTGLGLGRRGRRVAGAGPVRQDPLLVATGTGPPSCTTSARILWRRGLARVLRGWVDEGAATVADAARIAAHDRPRQRAAGVRRCARPTSGRSCGGAAVIDEAVVGRPSGAAEAVVASYHGYRQRGVPPAGTSGCPRPTSR